MLLHTLAFLRRLTIFGGLYKRKIDTHRGCIEGYMGVIGGFLGCFGVFFVLFECFMFVFQCFLRCRALA